MKEERPFMRYDQLINYFCERKKTETANIVKDKLMSFLEADKVYSKSYPEKN